MPKTVIDELLELVPITTFSLTTKLPPIISFPNTIIVESLFILFPTIKLPLTYSFPQISTTELLFKEFPTTKLPPTFSLPTTTKLVPPTLLPTFKTLKTFSL